MDNTQNVPDLEERKISPLSWNEFHSLTVALVQKMQAAPPPDIIVGLQRGGLIPAVTLSHHIGTQLLLSLPIRSTTSDEIYATKAPPAVGTLPLFEQIEGKRVLVVDDIVGSGATLRAALSLLHRYEPACIQSVVYVVNRGHWNSANHCTPTESITYIGKELSGWVVFPWEKGEQRAGPAETGFYRPHAGSDNRS